jgi:hypothetical protein
MVNKNQFIVFFADQEFSYVENIMCSTYASNKAGNYENAISNYQLLWTRQIFTCEFESLATGFWVFRHQFEVHVEILMQLQARMCAAGCSMGGANGVAALGSQRPRWIHTLNFSLGWGHSPSWVPTKSVIFKFRFGGWHMAAPSPPGEPLLGPRAAKWMFQIWYFALNKFEIIVTKGSSINCDF